MGNEEAKEEDEAGERATGEKVGRGGGCVERGLGGMGYGEEGGGREDAEYRDGGPG